MLNAHHYQAQLCDSHLSYEFLPKKEERLDLLQVGEALEKDHHLLDIKTPFVLVLKVKGVKVSIYASGKILTKNVPDKETAEKVFQTIVEWINTSYFKEK